MQEPLWDRGFMLTYSAVLISSVTLSKYIVRYTSHCTPEVFKVKAKVLWAAQWEQKWSSHDPLSSRSSGRRSFVKTQHVRPVRLGKETSVIDLVRRVINVHKLQTVVPIHHAWLPAFLGGQKSKVLAFSVPPSTGLSSTWTGAAGIFILCFCLAVVVRYRRRCCFSPPPCRPSAISCVLLISALRVGCTFSGVGGLVGEGEAACLFVF